MALVTVGLENLFSLVSKSFDRDGVFPISLEELEDHEQIDDIRRLLTALKPDFNTENVFALNVQDCTPLGIYTFRLTLKNGLPVIDFGANDGINEVVLTYKDKNFFAGDVKLSVVPKEYGKADSPPIFSLVLGEKKNSVSVMIYAKLAHDKVTFTEIDYCETQEELASLLGSIGTIGVKLTDLVRAQVRAGCKGQLPQPVIAEIHSWEIIDPPEDKPDYGQSVKFAISGVESALRVNKDESVEVVEKPQAVFISAKQASAKMVMSDMVRNLMAYINYGGKLLLKITAVNKNDPEKYMPTHILTPVLPEDEALKTALGQALKLLSENEKVKQADGKTIKVFKYSESQVYEMVPRPGTPTQSALPPASTPEVEPAKSAEPEEELATVGSTNGKAKKVDLVDIVPPMPS